ncbi:Hypothetical protein IALB_2374 [Ignavibacterium album JCM 16511]|uniref:Uncharacterized protein n=1 Tax=Ignavibacterium album (strain DSM 19864 / JCM 16511 / NBRC 101810 / Mat9-16) TaxID=945713 RepID=I0AM70_IGNAJ|nr:hypothetical protein [Ignavibacterium album]AFH50077.1 Hypothetical protein IALB_2374 [Ignavibacterium album JCM 16511]
MLRLLLLLLLFFLVYRIVRNFIKGYTSSDVKTKVHERKRVKSKYEDVEEAKYTEIKNDKEKNK